MTEKEAAEDMVKFSFIILIISVIISFLPMMLFPYYESSKYQELLNRLNQDNFTVVHDCDFRIDGIKALLTVERKNNVSAIYFLRPDADYFSQNIPYFQQLQNEGVRFGFHYDCLSRMNGNKTAATLLFIAELQFMRQFLTINYARSHGDSYNLKINNHDLYNGSLWKSLEVQDYSNESGLWKGYIADTNKHWSENWSQPILVNLHSDYW